MALNLLGPFTFAFFHNAANRDAPPELPKGRSEIVARKGVNGVGIQLIGEQGEPFEMISKVDVNSWADGVALTALYQSAVGTEDLFDLVWEGIGHFAEFGVKYAVMNAVPTKAKRVSGGRPILSATAAAWVECRWTLVPIREAISPDEGD